MHKKRGTSFFANHKNSAADFAMMADSNIFVRKTSKFGGHNTSKYSTS